MSEITRQLDAIWNGERAEKKPVPTPATSKQMDDLTQRIAYKLAGEHGLKQGDFAIKFWPSKRFAYSIKSGDGIIRVYWTHTPKHPDYRAMMHRCLANVALRKRDRRVGIVVYGAAKEMQEQIRAEFAEWQDLPVLLPIDEIECKELYRVEVKHRATGLTVVKEGRVGKKGTTFTRLTIDARLELSDLVGALLKSQEQSAKEKAGTNEETVVTE